MFDAVYGLSHQLASVTDQQAIGIFTGRAGFLGERDHAHHHPAVMPTRAFKAQRKRQYLLLVSVHIVTGGAPTSCELRPCFASAAIAEVDEWGLGSLREEGTTAFLLR
jgi:hypothetical protein